MTEISDRYRRLAAAVTETVEAVPADAWEHSSPCEGWSARDVLRHLVDVHVLLPGLGGVEVAHERSVDDDPVGAWLEVRDGVQEVLDDPERASREYDGRLGRSTVEQTIDGFLGLDLVVHRWDLARAAGLDGSIPADEAERLLAMTQGLGDDLRGPGVCGPAVEVPADAPVQDRLLGWLGRTP